MCVHALILSPLSPPVYTDREIELGCLDRRMCAETWERESQEVRVFVALILASFFVTNAYRIQITPINSKTLKMILKISLAESIHIGLSKWVCGGNYIILNRGKN